jgi:hypothetical protein
MRRDTQKRPHMERALFVVGKQNAGKSTLLRQMFVDRRLGTDGAIPEASRIKPVALSPERCLVIRCASPHERKETLRRFFDKVERDMERVSDQFWRFNYACALQPEAENKMPDLITICKKFDAKFAPERIRVILIDPRQDGRPGSRLAQSDVDELRSLSVEMAIIDAHRSTPRYEYSNGIFLADFFDFA